MEENNLPNTTSPESQKPNQWKLGFIVVLFMLIFSTGSLFYFMKSNTDLRNKITKPIISNEISVIPSPSVIPLTTPGQEVTHIISMQIEPYRLDDEAGQIIATFQVTNLNKEKNINKVTYWTDKKGACNAKTQPFSEFIKVPAEDIDSFVFFQFTSEAGDSSQIYAMSHHPIFQCGKLAE